MIRIMEEKKQNGYAVRIYQSTLDKINGDKGELNIAAYIDLVVNDHIRNKSDTTLKLINENLSSINNRVMTSYGLSIDILNRLGIINDLGDVTLRKVDKGEEAKVVVSKKD